MKKICSFIVLIVIICVCAYASIALAATSNIVQVIFVTDEQSVDAGVLSEPLVIQAQNSGREEEKLDSTADVIFTSSSATGEFLGSTGKVVTKTMNSGSANKTFYYKDSTPGVHTITVEIMPRGAHESWSAQQKIYIGTEKPTDAKDDMSAERAADVETALATKSKNTSKATNVKVSIGKLGTATIHTPIQFEPEISYSGKGTLPQMKFEWSFGDGDVNVGRIVKHVYYFPGEYNVVLVAGHGKEKTVSRTKVKVIDNLIVIASTSPGIYGFIELKNNSSSEVNIRNWKIKSGEREYIFSGETYIGAKGSIKIPNKVLHFEPAEHLELIFPTEERAYSYTPSHASPMAITNNITPIELTNVSAITMPIETSYATETASEPEKRNYATTVQAAITLPQEGWWSYIKSFFSVE